MIFVDAAVTAYKVDRWDSWQIAMTIVPLANRLAVPPSESPGYARAWGAMAWVQARNWVDRPSPGQRVELASPWCRPPMIEDDGSVVLSIVAGTTFVDALRGDRWLAENLSRLIGAPNTGRVFLRPTWLDAVDVARAVAELANDGNLDRAALISDCLDALTALGDSAAQRGLATLLEALEFSAADVGDRYPLLCTLLDTCHGSVTLMLLPVMFELADAAQLLELADAVFARPEKKQQRWLLKQLLRPSATKRFGAAGVATALAAVELTGDEQLIARASARRAALGISASAPASTAIEPPQTLIEWLATGTVLDRTPFAPITPTEAELSRFVSEAFSHPAITDDARFLDAMVRSHTDSGSIPIAWARGHKIRDRQDNNAAFLRLKFLPDKQPLWAFWQQLRSARDHYEHHRPFVRRPSRGTCCTWFYWTCASTISRAHNWESLLRIYLGDGLLSTPTWADGSIAFDDLFARLRCDTVASYGSFDLFVTLARLEPVEPDRAGELAGLSLPPWSGNIDGSEFVATPAVADGIEIIHRVVAAGGLHFPDATLEADGAVVGPPSASGLNLTDVFPAIPPAFFELDTRSFPGNHVTPNTIGLLPNWPDHHVTQVDRKDYAHSFPRAVQTLQAVTTAAGRFGPASVNCVFNLIGSPFEDFRIDATTCVIDLIEQGRYESDVFVSVAQHRLDTGRLSVTRITRAIEQVCLSGGTATIWPLVAAILDRAGAQPRKLAGVAELLAMMRRQRVPSAAIPTAVSDIAAAKSSSRARAEARALLAEASSCDRAVAS